jgi:hypothetical protein
MKTIKNSCGNKRGCSVTIILPNGGKLRKFSSRSIQGNIKKIPSLVSLSLDKELEKER